jgi:hypothetical protein
LKKEQNEYNQLKINSEQFRNAANGETLHSIAITLFNFLAKPTDIAQFNIIEHTFENDTNTEEVFIIYFLYTETSG